MDADLKVHGIKNLRVIDASVFPIIPDCRIQNAVYMVAEKVSRNFHQRSYIVANNSKRAPILSRPSIRPCIRGQMGSAKGQMKKNAKEVVESGCATSFC